MELDKIFSYLISPELQEKLLVVKIIFIFISLALLVMIFIFSLRTQYFKFRFLEDWVEFFTFQAYGKGKIAKIWRRIRKRVKGVRETEYKLAIIEADDLLDDILGKMGFPGKTLKEKLEKVTPSIISNLEQLKEVRKIRDEVLHNPDFKISQEETEKALNIYERTLQDLQAL